MTKGERKVIQRCEAILKKTLESYTQAELKDWKKKLTKKQKAFAKISDYIIKKKGIEEIIEQIDSELEKRKEQQ